MPEIGLDDDPIRPVMRDDREEEPEDHNQNGREDVSLSGMRGAIARTGRPAANR